MKSMRRECHASALPHVAHAAHAADVIRPSREGSRGQGRPAEPEAANQYGGIFAKTRLFTLKDVAGDWTNAQKTHFADGAPYDQLYQPGK